MSVAVIFGTRPEVIKLAPVIVALKERLGDDQVTLICTAQHREMLDELLNLFQIKPDYDLDVMEPNQNLNSLSSKLLNHLNRILIKEKPQRVIIQGDTTSCFIGALAAFHLGIAIDHVEAGLRTGDLLSPFPEEMNRRFCDMVSDKCYAATNQARDALIAEEIAPSSIHVTGNTVIDALLQVRSHIQTDQSLQDSLAIKFNFLSSHKKLLLVTGHRRENFGNGIRHICEALVSLSQMHDDLEIVYPVHLNPNVHNAVNSVITSQVSSIHLIEPQDYHSFIYLMERADIILSDSGGVQEEAPSLNTPLLVTRKNSERMESVQSGAAKLVGTDKNAIIENVTLLLRNNTLYNQMSQAKNPYGDGKAAEYIADIIVEKLTK